MSDLIRKHQSGNDHVSPWLGAYLDGEVASILRKQIEAHLEGCAACQAELEGLEQLSSLLHSSPPPSPRASDTAFARQVLERISHPVPPLWQRALRFSWRLAPLFLFTVWAFSQAVSWIAGLLLTGLPWIPGGEVVLQSLAPSSTSLNGWLLTGLMNSILLDPAVGELTGQISWLEPVGMLTLFNLALMVVLAVLFISWLASWWAYHRSRA